MTDFMGVARGSVVGLVIWAMIVLVIRRALGWGD